MKSGEKWGQGRGGDIGSEDTFYDQKKSERGTPQRSEYLGSLKPQTLKKYNLVWLFY
jgi:hypothetical protein